MFCNFFYFISFSYYYKIFVLNFNSERIYKFYLCIFVQFYFFNVSFVQNGRKIINHTTCRLKTVQKKKIKIIHKCEFLKKEVVTLKIKAKHVLKVWKSVTSIKTLASYLVASFVGDFVVVLSRHSTDLSTIHIHTLIHTFIQSAFFFQHNRACFSNKSCMQRHHTYPFTIATFKSNHPVLWNAGDSFLNTENKLNYLLWWADLING